MVKRVIFLSLSAVLLFCIMLPFVSAINLEIKKEVINDVVISEISEPAVFKFTIKNLGSTDNFEIYSLIGVDFSPRGTFPILSGETKEIEVSAYPDDALKNRPGLITFAYSIKGQDSGIMGDTLQIRIAEFKDVLGIGSEPVYPDSDVAGVYVENKYRYNFPEIKASFESAFIEEEEVFSLKPLEKKVINVSLDKVKLRGLNAGNYALTAVFSAGKASEEFKGEIRYAEKQGIAASERSSGIVFRERVTEKMNEGNIPVLAEVTIKKDVLSRLFTRFSSAPSFVERRGLSVYYTWSREIGPGEILSVTANTNYAYPLILIIAVIIAAYLTFVYTSSNLNVRKRVNFVKTKGGEFALKVTLDVSSRKYVENISIVERLPGIAKLYEKFGAYPPDKIDEANRKIEWHIKSLQPGEERLFSYVIYSKVGVVGRFELAPAFVSYVKDGKKFRALSNRAFFMNEPRARDD